MKTIFGKARNGSRSQGGSRRSANGQASRRPDLVGAPTDDVGIAVWYNRDGDHDVKVGSLLDSDEGGKPYVCATSKLSQLRDQLVAIQAIAQEYVDDRDVPQDVQDALAECLQILESGFNSPKPREKANDGNGLFAE